MRQTFRRFLGDRRGNIAMMSAICMLAMCGFAAFGVDVGSIFLDQRKTQSAADLAAIVAASNPTNATNAATAALVDNNYPATALVSVVPGVYVANSALPPQQRFTAAATPTNAVQVTLQTTTPLYFGKVLVGTDHYNVNATAIAATTAMASFAIGSSLVSVNGGLLNQVLGSMLGTSLSLSAMSYQALLSANIDAFDFMSALATQVNVTGVTYSQLLAGQIKTSDIVAALLTTQRNTNGNNSATIALSGVSTALAGLSTKVSPQVLINPGPYSTMTTGQKPQVAVPVSVLDMLSAIAVLSNGTNQIAAAVNLGLPGIASVSLLATIGEQPVGSSWLTVGAVGASVHTAQTRILLQVQLLGSGSVSVVNLPVYVEIAAGTATLNAVQCGYPNVSTSSVTLGVSPGIVDAWIGGVTTADMTNFSTKPNPPPAQLVNLGLIQVYGLAHATMANSSPTSVTFSYADIQAMTKKTVNTTSYLSSLTSSLLGNLSLNVTVIGLGLPIPGLGALVAGIIGGATASVDQLIASVLQTLGVSLGQATTWVTGVRCDGAVLVN
jgi:tight adherence protein G